MNIKITPYENEHINQVVEFNKRLTEKDAGFVFPEVSSSDQFPDARGNPVKQNLFVAVDEETKEIHGGYILKSQPVWKLGVESVIGNYQLPLSEGIVNPIFSMVGIQIYLDAIKKQSQLYSLGMGSLDRPLPKFLKKMKWTIEGVPFYFKIHHPGRVINQLPALRTHSKVKPFLFFLDNLKLFSIGMGMLNFLTKLKFHPLTNYSFTIEKNFGDWANPIWESAKVNYQWIAKRDKVILNLLYEEKSERFIRLHVKKGQASIGWALVLATPMKNHKQFGNLFVGTIADVLAIKGEEYAVAKIAADYLREENVDLVVSNQSHVTWSKALKGLGFLSGPTNYIAAFSPAMWSGISSFSDCHINRGDGDGPINL